MFDFVSRGSLMDADPAPAGDGAGANPNPGAIPFDPVAFKAEILGEFRKDINGGIKGLKTDFAKMLADLKPAAPPAPPANGDPNEPPASKDPALNAALLEVKQLKAKFETSQESFKALEAREVAALAKAESTERQAMLRDTVGKILEAKGFEFQGTRAQADFLRLVSPEMERSEDGALIAGGLPLDKYVESLLTGDAKYMLKGKAVGGAGSRDGKPGTGARRWTLADLEPVAFAKLTPQEQTDARNAVAVAMGQPA